MITKIWRFCLIGIGRCLGLFQQEATAYTLTDKDIQVVKNIETIMEQANKTQQGLRDDYRALFNRQTSERKKRVLLEVYIHKDQYLIDRKIDFFIDHVDIPSLQLLSEEYRKDKKHVYYIGYRQDGEVFDYQQEIFHTLTGVDIASFQVYDTKQHIKDLENSYNYVHGLSFEGSEIFVYYAKDTHHVYINGLSIQWANPNTYEVLPRGIFAKDDDQIFFRQWYAPYAPNIPLAQVDVESFEVLSRFYAKDKQYVYEISNCGGGSGRETCVKRVKNADPESFVVLPFSPFETQDLMAYDKNALYSRMGFRIPNGDRATFKILNYYYAQDKNAVYCLGDANYPEAQKIVGADVNSFHIVSERNFFAKDNNHSYYRCQQQENPNTEVPDHIERISGSSYYADKKQNKLYVRKNGLEATNLPYSWFQLLTGEGMRAGFGIYENQLYFYDKLVPNIDIKSFTRSHFGNAANDHIVKDKNAVYYIGELERYDLRIITGADSKTFTGVMLHYEYPDGTSYDDTLWDYYQDKNHIYRTAYPLPAVDKASFQRLWEAYIYGKATYSRDKSHIYANADIVSGADVKTFRVIWSIEWFDAMDKNAWYLGGERIGEI